MFMYFLRKIDLLYRNYADGPFLWQKSKAALLKIRDTDDHVRAPVMGKRKTK